jgi:hypothetical protein
MNDGTARHRSFNIDLPYDRFTFETGIRRLMVAISQ